MSLACPLPLTAVDRIQLGHGAGGRMSATLLHERILPHFTNDLIAPLGDAAVAVVNGAVLAFSTDTFVVTPLEFPGGNIGSLAVHGTVNDLAMMGAHPLYLSAGFVLEEGLPFEVLDRVVAAMARAAREAGVQLVTGDTKVVERGKADGLFVNTSGIGVCRADFTPGPSRIQPGDAVIVSGPIGRHGMAIMCAREDLGLASRLETDSAPLHSLVHTLWLTLGDDVRTLRDPTRGGVASALNELAVASNVGIEVDELALPVPADVNAACEMLGLDPLYVANEGVLLAFVPAARAAQAEAALRSLPLGAGARIIGHATDAHRGMVVMRTVLGSTRVVDMLPGDQLPRIC